MISVAQYILVVEKESVFQRLANDQFCGKNRCIVLTVSSLLFQSLLAISLSNAIFVREEAILMFPQEGFCASL